MTNYKPLSICFFGTPEFAVYSLNALIGGPDKVILVITQPDRPRGRGNDLVKSPVRIAAEAYGIPVLTPERASEEGFVRQLAETAPDLSVVVAYGQILKKSMLDIPPLGTVNVHASILPEYRGAAPINRAIIDGKTVTGVSTMLLDEGMDTGNILLVRETPIGNDETAGELSSRLAVMGAELLMETIREIRQKAVVPRPQDHSRSTYASMLKKEEGLIDWGLSPERIKNHVRGMIPWPGAYTRLGEEIIKIFGVKLVGDECQRTPGTIERVTDEGIFVATGKGVVVVTELQAPGKRRMSAAEFIRGKKIPLGSIFR